MNDLVEDITEDITEEIINLPEVHVLADLFVKGLEEGLITEEEANVLIDDIFAEW